MSKSSGKKPKNILFFNVSLISLISKWYVLCHSIHGSYIIQRVKSRFSLSCSQGVLRSKSSIRHSKHIIREKTRDCKPCDKGEGRVWNIALLCPFWKKKYKEFMYHSNKESAYMSILPFHWSIFQKKGIFFYTMNIFWPDWNLASLILHSW